MPKIAYEEWNPNHGSLVVIVQANKIIEEYQDKGFDLTLRQLYYQFVARGLIANKQSEYNRLGAIINRARLAGYIDWDAITDRTRMLRENPHWDNPGDIIQSAAYSFAIDKWANQSNRVEVWIEKDALVGVIEKVCKELDVPYFSCRGYTSQSEMWRAATHRALPSMRQGKDNYILHLGDHDPSGMDMTRDIADRMRLFTGRPFEVKRLALNMDQVDELNPPPNPAKLSDTRAQGYILEYGSESWELDALDPEYLYLLIEREVLNLRDEELWIEDTRRETRMKKALDEIAEEHNHDNW